jgi:hypothetical protein
VPSYKSSPSNKSGNLFSIAANDSTDAEFVQFSATDTARLRLHISEIPS